MATALPRLFAAPQVEAYFQSVGALSWDPNIGELFYWIGVTRQPSPNNYATSAPGSSYNRWITVTGEVLSPWAPSNGPDQGPLYAPYAHWSPSQWGANRQFAYGSAGGQGDCVLSDIYWGWVPWRCSTGGSSLWPRTTGLDGSRPSALSCPWRLPGHQALPACPFPDALPPECNRAARRQYTEYTSDVAWFAKDTVGTFTNYANWQATSTWTDWTNNGGPPVASNIGVPWSWGSWSCAAALPFMCE